MTDIVLYYEKSYGDLYIVLTVERGAERRWKQREIELRGLLDKNLEKLLLGVQSSSMENRFVFGVVGLKDRIIKPDNVHNHFYMGEAIHLAKILEDYRKLGVTSEEGIPEHFREVFRAYNNLYNPSMSELLMLGI